jgi:hypothetical protein
MKPYAPHAVVRYAPSVAAPATLNKQSAWLRCPSVATFIAGGGKVAVATQHPLIVAGEHGDMVPHAGANFALGCRHCLDRAGRRFKYLSCSLATIGIVYRPVTRAQRRMIGHLALSRAAVSAISERARA